MLSYKQTDEILYPEINTDGCLLLSLIDIACEAVGEELTPFEVNTMYNYLMPVYMKDGREEYKNRCYILDHEAVIQCALYLLGVRHAGIEYSYRKDEDDYIIGNAETLGRCNYFITKLSCGTYMHFVRTDESGKILYNSGTCAQVPISQRGYRVNL